MKQLQATITLITALMTCTTDGILQIIEHGNSRAGAYYQEMFVADTQRANNTIMRVTKLLDTPHQNRDGDWFALTLHKFIKLSAIRREDNKTTAEFPLFFARFFNLFLKPESMLDVAAQQQNLQQLLATAIPQRDKNWFDAATRALLTIAINTPDPDTFYELFSAVYMPSIHDMRSDILISTTLNLALDSAVENVNEYKCYVIGLLIELARLDATTLYNLYAHDVFEMIKEEKENS